MIAREAKRLKLVEKYKKKRMELKEIILSPKSSFEEVHLASIQLQKLPRNSSPVRHQRRCSITGRPHAVYRRFTLSRHKLREAAMNGFVPGLTKASW